MLKPLRTDEDYNGYVKDFYRKIEDYDWVKVVDCHIGLESHLHRYRERRIKQLVSQYGAGQKFLDVGCGTGLVLRHLPEGSVGIDLNPRHLERAKRHAPKAVVQQSDAESLPFADTSFDTVVCTEVLEHLVFPEKAVAEIFRVLKPGGRFIGSTPSRSLLWRFRFLSSTHLHNEPFHNEFRRNELTELLSPLKTLFLRRDFLWSTFFFVCEKTS